MDRDAIYEEVAEETILMLDNARHAFMVQYERGDKSEATLALLERLGMALESAKIRLESLSPTWRGVN